MNALLLTAAVVLGFGGHSPATDKPASNVNVYAVVKSPNGPVEAPLFDPAYATLPIARVAGETIQLADLAEALNSMHENTLVGKRGKQDFRRMVDRLIGARLVVLEATEMGLDELPEVKEAMETFRVGAPRDFVKLRATEKVKVDQAVLDRLYKENTREFKVRSLLFQKPEDAKAFVFAVREGADFETQAKAAVAQKKATSEPASDFVPRRQMLPELLQALAGAKEGTITEAITIPGGSAVLRVEDVRNVEDKFARAEIEAQLLEGAKEQAIRDQAVALSNKHGKLNQKLVDAIDFEAAKPGFEAMTRDQRVIATVAGKNITVGQLATEIEKSFHHGIDTPLKEKRVNVKKPEALAALVRRLAYDAEAAQLKITETDDYTRAVAAYRTSVLFGVFVNRALLPGIEVKEGELKREYEKNKLAYSYPAFYRLHSLAFLDANAAQVAAQKLKSGTDLKWLRANADRQVPQDARAFELDGKVLTTEGLTPELAKAIKGAKKGDVRIAKQRNQHFVVLVQEITPPRPRPYPEVRATIAQKVQAEKVKAALDDWIAKARKAQPVEILITQLSVNK